ncbi:UNVERIFIED_CONTAM: hypothetical protein FKN15_052447 [Acipenser sinensis]
MNKVDGFKSVNEGLRVECRMCPIAWTSLVRDQDIPLPTVDGSSQGSARVFLTRRVPATPVIWPGACGLACKLPESCIVLQRCSSWVDAC